MDWKEMFALSKRHITIDNNEVSSYIKNEVEIINNIFRNYDISKTMKYEGNKIILEGISIAVQFGKNNWIRFKYDPYPKYFKKASIVVDGGLYKIEFYETGVGKKDWKVVKITQKEIDDIFKLFFGVE